MLLTLTLALLGASSVAHAALPDSILTCTGTGSYYLHVAFNKADWKAYAWNSTQAGNSVYYWFDNDKKVEGIDSTGLADTSFSTDRNPGAPVTIGIGENMTLGGHDARLYLVWNTQKDSFGVIVPSNSKNGFMKAGSRGVCTYSSVTK
jgi:hypothetical protein